MEKVTKRVKARSKKKEVFDPNKIVPRGLRPTKSILTAQGKLLDFIFKKHGGVTKIARKLGVSRALIFFWRSRGYVPLVHCGKLSRILEVTPYALNFCHYSQYIEKERAWDSVVKEVRG